MNQPSSFAAGSPPESDQLSAVQQWMQAVLFDLADESEAAAAIDTVITPSRQLSAVQRLNVYRHAYVARLLDCLRDEFLTVCKFLGSETFDTLAAAYLHTYPSQSYMLAELGARFPAFLAAGGITGSETTEANRPFEAAIPFTGQQFLVDLATLERTYAEVFDGPGTEGVPPLTAADIAAIPAETWPLVRLQLAPCVRLLPLSYPVHTYVTACRQATDPPLPEPQPIWLIVTRRNFVVRRIETTALQFALLQQLQQGLPLADALEQTAQTDADYETLQRDLQLWFHEWTAAGYIVSVMSP